MKHMKIKTKMTFLMVVVLVMQLGIGVMGFVTTDNMAGRSHETYQESLLPVSYVSQMRTNNRAIESFVLELMITKDAAAVTTLNGDIKEKISKNDELFAQLQAVSYNDNAIMSKLKEYSSQLPNYRAQWDQIIRLSETNQKTEAYALYTGEFSDFREKMINLLKDATALMLKDAEAHEAANSSDATEYQALSLIIIATVMLICVIISIVITRMITRPLKELQGLMQGAEKGDLTLEAKYDSKDEIGTINRSFNSMLVSLRAMMMSVSESAEMLSASSQQMSASAEQTTLASRTIAETSNEIASGFEEQNLNITRTTQAVMGMMNDIAKVEQNSYEMASLMGVVSETTDRGVTAVEEIIDQMKHTKTVVSESKEIVGNLAGLSEQINTIITTINEISAQTNLLSLNASIEAARAGEHGRGFAVVAGEIRKLSEATGRSSLQITGIITSILEETGKAMESMEIGSEVVSQGVARSSLVSEAFSEIQASIKEAAQQTADIRSAIEHISQESQGVTEAMEQVNEISRAGAEGVQDTSAASEEQLSAMEEMTSSSQYLATLAEELQKSMSFFRL